MTNNIDIAHLNRQVDVIVSNIIRAGTNKHLAKEYAEYLIKFINFEVPQQRTAAEGEDTRRAWVGLTDEKISTIEHEVYSRTVQKGKHMSVFIQQFAKAIDSALKEKNSA
jgi:hypothetical protein